MQRLLNMLNSGLRIAAGKDKTLMTFQDTLSAKGYLSVVNTLLLGILLNCSKAVLLLSGSTVRTGLI